MSRSVTTRVSIRSRGNNTNALARARTHTHTHTHALFAHGTCVRVHARTARGSQHILGLKSTAADFAPLLKTFWRGCCSCIRRLFSSSAHTHTQPPSAPGRAGGGAASASATPPSPTGSRCCLGDTENEQQLTNELRQSTRCSQRTVRHERHDTQTAQCMRRGHVRACVRACCGMPGQAFCTC